MIKSWAHFALARVIEEGAREAAIQALKGCDPLIKPFVKSKAVTELRKAEQTSGSDDPRHLARVAAFSLFKKDYESDYDDIDGLKREYEEVFGTTERPRSGPVVLGGILGTLTLTTTLASLLYFQLRPFEPSQNKIGKLMQDSFTLLAIGAVNGTDQQVDQALNEFGKEPAFHSQEELAALARSAQNVRDNLDALEPYERAALKLNRSFFDQQVPYYVDADIYPIREIASPILLSFYVQERGTYVAEEKNISVLRLWRLDHLNVAQSKLGYTRPSSPHAIALLDNVEHDLVTQILPAVPEGEIMSLTDDDTSLSSEEWVAELQEEGGEMISKHYASMPPEVTDKARRLGKLLALRRALLAKWQKNLGSEAFILRMPRRLIPEADYSAELNIRVSASDRVEWDSLHSDLLSTSSINDFEEIREAYVRSVERHEVQHRLDYAAERIEIPEMLAMRMGGIERMGHKTTSLPHKASLELSAYLSQIADDPAPRLALLTMSRIALNKYSMRTAHGYAGVVALEATAKHLEIGEDAILGRVATRPELARLLARIGDRPMTKVKAAARQAYEELFGEKLPAVQRQPFHHEPSWRH